MRLGSTRPCQPCTKQSSLNNVPLNLHLVCPYWEISLTLASKTHTALSQRLAGTPKTDAGMSTEKRMCRWPRCWCCCIMSCCRAAQRPWRSCAGWHLLGYATARSRRQAVTANAWTQCINAGQYLAAELTNGILGHES